MNRTPTTSQPENRRILVIDDNPSIHDDFRKILSPEDAKLAAGLDADEAALFGEIANSPRSWTFQIDSAFQGKEGLEKVREASADGAPYAVAFVDVRMPPGWDGIETISRIWKGFPDLQMVVCTAYSDYSWDEMVKVMTRHVRDKHPDVAKQMEKMHNEDPKRWGKEMRPKWDAAPDV